MRMPRTLRWRLTLSFMMVAGVTILVAAVGTWLLLEQAVWGPLDAALQEEAETLVGIEAAAGHTEPAHAVHSIAQETDEGPGKFVRLKARAGAPVLEAGSPGGLANVGIQLDERTTSMVLTSNGTPYRVAWAPTANGGWVQIGVSALAPAQVLRRAHSALIAGTIVILAALFFFAWTITTRAAVELEAVAAEIETIEAGSLDQRVGGRQTTEIDRLVTVTNRLLTRLDAAMERLRRFTADAAHELRTPIAALRARLEVTLAHGRTPAEHADGLLDALEQCERLGRLAENLLMLSSLESGGRATGADAPQTVRLDRLVREVVDSLRPLAQEAERTFTATVEDPLVVFGTPTLLKRALVNLVDNAFRHTPATAAVYVEARRRASAAEVVVRDEGPGIPPAEQRLAFERFHRGSHTTEGTGLGLALCREVILRHGGQIALTSTPGSGTAVVVTVPLATASRDAPGNLPLPARPMGAAAHIAEDRPRTAGARATTPKPSRKRERRH